MMVRGDDDDDVGQVRSRLTSSAKCLTSREGDRSTRGGLFVSPFLERASCKYEEREKYSQAKIKRWMRRGRRGEEKGRKGGGGKEQ